MHCLFVCFKCDGYSCLSKNTNESSSRSHERYVCEGGSELSNDQVLKVYPFLATKDKVFFRGETDLGSFTAVKHHIDTGDARPIKQKMRRTPLGYANEERGHLEKLLEAGVIEPSASKWASPGVLVRKRDGSVRWCIDLRKLKDLMQRKWKNHEFG